MSPTKILRNRSRPKKRLLGNVYSLNYSATEIRKLKTSCRGKKISRNSTKISITSSARKKKSMMSY